MRRLTPSAPLRSRGRLAIGGLMLLAAVGLGLVASDLSSGDTAGARATPRGRPNIILIQSDDQTMRQFTNRVMPNTMRLLTRHGTKFTDYIATTAQCCPSRASLLTGQYAHNNGVTSNDAAYPALIDKHNVLPQWLRQSGYRTMHVGKFLNGYVQFASRPSRVAPGWTDWYTVLRPGTHYYDYRLGINGRLRHRGHKPKDYIARVLGKEAVHLIKTQAPRRRPFYLQLDERGPHVGLQNDPYGSCDRTPIPDRRDEKLFRKAPLPRRSSFNEADMSDKPAFLRSKPRIDPSEKRRIRRHWRCALASLAGVDRDVGKVFDAVKKAGELYKTVFIFISDNGLFYGEHRIASGKVLPYEEGLRLPLVIRMPKRYLRGAKRAPLVGRPVANIDLAPTILDLTGAQPCLRNGPCRTMDGRSLMPLLTRSGGWPHDRGLLTEYRVSDAGRYATCEFAGIRTSDNIYVVHSRVVDPATSKCIPADQRERYNLKKDPFELNNLCAGGSATNCPTSAKQSQLQVRLNQLRDCAGIAGRDQQVNGRPYCE